MVDKDSNAPNPEVAEKPANGASKPPSGASTPPSGEGATNHARPAGSATGGQGGSFMGPRGATPSELDALRATIKVSPRGQPVMTPPRANAPYPPLAQAVIHRGEIDRIIDEGRSLLETDVKAAHEIFTRAWRRNLNDPRVLSNFGLTLVLVEGDRQRGIRFCEEALRRGLQTTETLVNLAKALVVTRNKEQAVRALRKAMDLAPDDPRVGAEFAALGLRRPPPIPFLPRSFFLNKWIGRLTWRWSRRYRLDPFSG
jgi:tetratricopeptide (TPR) repeat protein